MGRTLLVWAICIAGFIVASVVAFHLIHSAASSIPQYVVTPTPR